MTLAITDACIFIDLYELELSADFFSLNLEIHTSLDVFNELYPHQQQLLKAYQSIGKLIVHNLSMEDRLAIIGSTYPKALSDNDKTVLFLAEKLDAIVISSDRAVRQFAKTKSIEYHGMLWIFDRLVEVCIITHVIACEKLKKLIASNLIYQNNSQLVAEMDRRLKSWSAK